MIKVLLLLSIFMSISVSGQDIRELHWNDLVPEGLVFDDPFARLTETQLYLLGRVARVEMLLENKPHAVNDAMKAESDSLSLLLANEGVDAKQVLSKREYVTEMRAKNLNAVVTDLHQTKVKIPGYLLPLNYSNGESTEFLLVPWVGACIHTPPPPNNQIVHLFHTEGYKSPMRFQPVIVEGTIYAEKSKAELYLVDGSDNIQSAYTMKETLISPIK